MKVILRNVLTGDMLARVREQVESGNWANGRETAGGTARGAKSNQQLRADDPAACAAGATVLQALAGNSAFISRAIPAQIHPPLFNRHGPGNAYGEHVDSALMALPNGAGTLRTDLSATLFLSEPDEYGGGELAIREGNSTQHVKEAAGDMILYDSGSAHQVLPVTRGSRVACVLWIQSSIADRVHRELLLELDDCVQLLSAPGQSVPQAADQSATLRLSGLYHNLVRLWARG